MKRSRIITTTMLASALLIGATWQGCEKPTENGGDTCSELTVVKPGGGETYNVGDNVKVEWCYPDPFADAGVVVLVSTDGGKSWSEPLGSGQIDKPTTTMTWTVGAEHVGESVKLRVEGYNTSSLYDVSEPFTVEQ